MRSRITFITCIAFLTLTPAGFGTENDRLTREERDRVGHLYAKVMRDKQVTEARRVHAEATKHYHDVLRQAMIKRDPKIRPALGKIQINPALLAEAIWEKRNKDILDNLHLPVRRLGTEERKRWDQAMDNLQKREITKAFSKRLENNYRQQAKLRKEQVRLMGDFKKEARRKLLEIDGHLKPILEKLDRPSVIQTIDGRAAPNVNPAAATATGSDKVNEEEAELVPPMPIPMPAPAEEC